MDRVGPYEVHEQLGRGGMGTVHRAIDTRTGQAVALKLLAAGEERARRRLLLEARALSRLRHRNVVSLLEVGEERGRPWLALELVRGRSLEERLAREGPLRPRDAALLVRSLAAGLAHAHREGVLHRDLKPANVLLPDGGGEPRLGDFGLAGLAVEPSQSRLTKSGTLLGSPGYWAPEQAAGETGGLGPHTDVYGLGALLYAALSGRPPIQGESLVDVLTATARERPAATGADPELDRLALRCLEKRPEDRPASVDAVARELSRWLAGRALAGPRRLVVGLASLLLVGGGAVWFAAASLERPAAPQAPAQVAVPSTSTSVEPVELAGAPAIEPDQVTTLVLQGLALRRDGHLEAARAALDRALELDPRSVRGLLERGLVRVLAKDPRGGLEDLERALVLAPDEPSALAGRGAGEVP